MNKSSKEIDFKAEFAQLLVLIKNSKKIAVFGHYNPDPDAYGSSLAIYQALESLGKDVTCYNQSKTIEHFEFIPKISEVKNSYPSEEFDLFLICDCGDLARLGDEFQREFEKSRGKVAKVVNIDHHESNSKFGDINLVFPDIASTCEIIFELLLVLEIEISKDIAMCLLSGIMTDTGSFRYSNVTKRTFEIAAELLEMGASTSEIANAVYASKPMNEFQFEAEAFNRIEIFSNGKVSGIIVSKELMDKYSCDGTNTEGFVERARSIKGVEISFLLREDPDKLKVSMRSKTAKFNVAKIAESFGGGGHVQAAAFRYSGKIEELKKKLLAKIEEVL